jgi:UDP-glucose 4-epimerase
MKKRILVTGGAGYIGAHTMGDLIEHGYEVFCVDNFSRSDQSLIEGVERICGKKVPFEQLELTNKNEVLDFFGREKFDGIIHFAAFKSVGESVLDPLLYYHNNCKSLLHILLAMQQYSISNFIFSSSCSVYGNLSVMQVNELTPLGKANSPYGRTKQIAEEMIVDFAKQSSSNFISLRYFNPVGAHPSAQIGEISMDKPSNVFPALLQFALGKLKEFYILGNDYPTPDGTCIRDYVHVCDIAKAHRLALEYCLSKKAAQNYEVINLGTGKGLSVKEIVQAVEKIIHVKLDCTLASRRPGDVSSIYTSNKLAYEKLGWQADYQLEDMIKSAWEWEKSRLSH